MPRRLAMLVGWAWVAVSSPLSAQTTAAAAPEPHPCDAQTGATKLVCRAGYDAISAMAPVGALAVSRGNPGLGTAAAGRRFGDLILTFRGNYVGAAIPATGYDGHGDTVALARRLPVAIPSLDLRFTLIRRTLPMGAIAVDALGTITGIPRRATDLIRFGDDVRSLGGVVLGFGYGIRIGVEPKGPLPVVSLNVGRSDLPRFALGDLAAGSNFAYSLAVSALNARLMVGRAFGAFELTGGAGVDLIKGDYSLTYVDQASHTPKPRADSTVSTMRIMTALNAAFRLGPVARLTFEGGFQVGKNDKLPTIFEGTNTKSGRFFGGVGLGFKL